MANDNKSIRVRFAPSPTGQFHIGSARAALFNFLYAKKFAGTFILRIEDTDRQRSEDQFVKDILDCLLWLGIGWDEGPQVGGPAAPYFQSERLAMYQKCVDQLLAEKKAYKCFCSPEELTKEKEAQQKKGAAPKYTGTCRDLKPEAIAKLEAAKKPFSIRFKVDGRKVKFDDMIHGPMEFDANLFGDFVITRTDGSPLFLLTNTVDDNAMQVTHVLRGDDHLSNTAKQILLAEGLNFLSPQFGHLPLIMNPDRSKLSKRKNPVSVSADYRQSGYLPEAIVNYLALLGWNPGTDREIFTLHELIEEFSIERVNNSNAIFDHDKLLWMNGHYIRHMAVGDLAARASEFLTQAAIKKASRERPEFFLQAVSLVQDRIKLLSEVEEHIAFCFVTPEYDAKLLIAKKSDEARTKTALTAATEALTKISAYTLDELEVALRATARHHGLTDGEMLWTVRAALTGLPASPGVFEVLEVLGRDESLKRIASASKKLT
ncbi:MAG TPA: glutamate--tRNA ligase [Candidatus Saccharimonadales bacterium]|nr:glutamate--tRNA ligase [Candidatus Saccharimonadales bacterium]